MIGIILVVTNEKHNLKMLFNSLLIQTYKNFKIYFVDNNSSDGSVEYFKELNSHNNILVEYLILDNNYGFAKGNNIGAKCAIKDGCDYIFVLNNDTELDSCCLEELINVVRSDENIGITSPIFLKWNKEKVRNIIQLYGAKANFRTQKHDLIAQDECFEEIKLPETLEVDYVSGGVTFCKSEVINNIGLFEEKYFIYNDEIDLGFRAKKAGIKTVVTHKAKVWHNHNWSKKNIGGYKFMYYYMTRNRILYFKKFSLPVQLLKYLVIEIIALPVKLKMFYRMGSLSITKYFYLGMWRGLMGETGKSNIDFNK